MRDYAAVGGWVEFVPEFDGNREEFEAGLTEEPITLEIKPMTVRESQRQAGNVKAKTSGGGVRTNVVDIRQGTFTSHVRNIKGLLSGGKPVVTAEQLLDTGLADLVAEVEAAINDISRLDEGDVKNCRSRSVGTGKPSDGTA